MKFPYPSLAVTARDKCACAMRTCERLRLEHCAQGQPVRTAAAVLATAAGGADPDALNPLKLPGEVVAAAPDEAAAFVKTAKAFYSWRKVNFDARYKTMLGEMAKQRKAAGLEVVGDTDDPATEAKEYALRIFSEAAARDTKWDAVDLEKL